jgi:pyruvate-formate lyase-activating enzyme
MTTVQGSTTCGYRCPFCGNWEYGEYHLCGGPSIHSSVTITVPSFEDRVIEQLTRIADALERIAK